MPILGNIDDVVEVSCPSPLPDRLLEEKEHKYRLKEYISRLSPTLREVVLLSLVEEMTDREIALVLGIPIGTVKSRKNRGLLKFKQYYLQ